jgi:O-antigen/teichoic acid export membrane protein
MGLLSRLLSPEEFGLAAVASVLTGFGAMLSDLGIAAAVVQRNTLSEGEIKLAFVITVALGVGFALVVLAGSGLVETFMAIPGSAVVVNVMTLGFVLSSFGTVSRSLLQRNLLFNDCSL